MVKLGLAVRASVPGCDSRVADPFVYHWWIVSEWLRVPRLVLQSGQSA